MADGKEKIVILGGGMSSLTTAFELTNRPGWQDNYDITVYQVGWRLGGKGASGRGPNGRIEEHGLHIWIGFYENAFRLIRLAYLEMVERRLCSPDAPLATFERAFKKHSLIMVEEQENAGFDPWIFQCPTNDAVPGDPLPDGSNQHVSPEFPSLDDYFGMLIQVVHTLFHGSLHRTAHSTSGASEGPLKRIEEAGESDVEAIEFEVGRQMLETATGLAAHLSSTANAKDAPEHPVMVDHFEKFIAWFRNRCENDIANDAELRHLFVMLDLCIAAVRGVVSDGLVQKGLDSIDEYDFREWLMKHGAASESANSAATRFLYDLGFAYVDGDGNKPSLAAGVAIRCLARVFFTYKGAIFWKMQAGMGDTIFTPIYYCLRARGVKFRFFHRVHELVPTEDGKSIASIRVGRQVDLVDGSAEYNPLTPVEGVDCWPAEPLYEQIADARELQAQDINLESFWTPWQEKEEIVLEAGKDFDKVVLGISLAALKYTCPKIMDQKLSWRDMYDNVKTTRTMGLQLWLKPDLETLGWNLGSPVLDGYINPLNTWADMSQLLVREQWSGDQVPKSLAYFCGTVTGDIPPESESGYPAEADELAYEASLKWMEQSITGIWPRAGETGAAAGLDWNLLVDGENGTGPQRLKSQFWRVNIDPSERYVLSAAGSTCYRMKAEDSGYDNLVLTGDWIDNGFNVGCIEASVMSGMLASTAVAGYPGQDAIIGMGKP